jgi:hypothetical protein
MVPSRVLEETPKSLRNESFKLYQNNPSANSLISYYVYIIAGTENNARRKPRRGLKLLIFRRVLGTAKLNMILLINYRIFPRRRVFQPGGSKDGRD